MSTGTSRRRLLRDTEAARRLRLRRGTLANRRWKKQGPAWIKIGRAVRYREEDIEEFIEQHRVQPDGTGRDE
jgi:predicted DNA-binding transcriptional regulator AlpA